MDVSGVREIDADLSRKRAKNLPRSKSSRGIYETQLFRAFRAALDEPGTFAIRFRARSLLFGIVLRLRLLISCSQAFVELVARTRPCSIKRNENENGKRARREITRERKSCQASETTYWKDENGRV